MDDGGGAFEGDVAKIGDDGEGERGEKARGEGGSESVGFVLRADDAADVVRVGEEVEGDARAKKAVDAGDEDDGARRDVR